MITRRRAVVLNAATVAVGLAIATPASAQTQQDQIVDKDQVVEEFVTKYLERYNKKDAAGVAAMYADGGVLVPPGPMTTGKQDIEKFWKTVFETGRTGLRYDSQQSQIEGSVVVSVGQFTVMVPDEKGVLQERHGNFANVYKWTGSELKFLVHAFNFIPAR
jgi:uncharacterized protein (TIGR02246 family)